MAPNIRNPATRFPPAYPTGHDCILTDIDLAGADSEDMMDFGLFLEFPRHEGGTEQQAFEEAFALVDLAAPLPLGEGWGEGII